MLSAPRRGALHAIGPLGWTRLLGVDVLAQRLYVLLAVPDLAAGHGHARQPAALHPARERVRVDPEPISGLASTQDRRCGRRCSWHRDLLDGSVRAYAFL